MDVDKNKIQQRTSKKSTNLLHCIRQRTYSSPSQNGTEVGQSNVQDYEHIFTLMQLFNTPGILFMEVLLVIHRAISRDS